ncbi:MAG TPA: hypothetical protein VIX35_11110, partial [Vicinamibacterales bacterium]
MFYVEMMRTRITLLWSLFALGVLCAIALALLLLWPAQMRVTSYTDGMCFVIVGGIAALIAAIVGSILGSSLAVENCEHLEIAWTKPISRMGYAAGLFLVDLACLAIIFAVTFGLAYGMVSLYVGGPIHVPFDQDTAWKMARFMLFPVAWFGLGQALTSGSSGKIAGLVIGLMWPVFEFLSVLAAPRTVHAVQPLGSVWHTILSVLNLVNPIG